MRCLLLNYDVARIPKSRCFKLSKIRSREWQTIRYMRVFSSEDGLVHVIQVGPRGHAEW